MKQKIIIIALSVAVVLFAGAFFLKIQKNRFLQKQVAALQIQGDQRRALWNSVQLEAGILDIFVSDILLAKKEIPLSVRVKIEEKIKATDDVELKRRWSAFAESKNQEEGQKAGEELLRYLVSNIRKKME